ncbi:unnamed protein product, partial [Symbiodinium sp. KB8]
MQWLVLGPMGVLQTSPACDLCNCESRSLAGWIRVESRSKPGSFYYAHPATKRTQLERPVDPRYAQREKPKAVVEPQPAPAQDPVTVDDDAETLEEKQKREEERKAEQRAREEAEEKEREEVLLRARQRRAQQMLEEEKRRKEEEEQEEEERQRAAERRREKKAEAERLRKEMEDKEKMEAKDAEAPKPVALGRRDAAKVEAKRRKKAADADSDDGDEEITLEELEKWKASEEQHEREEAEAKRRKIEEEERRKAEAELAEKRKKAEFAEAVARARRMKSESSFHKQEELRRGPNANGQETPEPAKAEPAKAEPAKASSASAEAETAKAEPTKMAVPPPQALTQTQPPPPPQIQLNAQFPFQFPAMQAQVPRPPSPPPPPPPTPPTLANLLSGAVAKPDFGKLLKQPKPPAEEDPATGPQTGTVLWYNGRRKSGMVLTDRDSRRLRIPSHAAVMGGVAPPVPAGLMHGTRVNFMLDTSAPGDPVCVQVRPLPNQVGLSCGGDSQAGQKLVNEDRTIATDLQDPEKPLPAHALPQPSKARRAWGTWSGSSMATEEPTELPKTIVQHTRELVNQEAMRRGAAPGAPWEPLTEAEEVDLIRMGIIAGLEATDRNFLGLAQQYGFKDGAAAVVAIIMHGFQSSGSSVPAAPGGQARLFAAWSGTGHILLLRGRQVLRCTEILCQEFPSDGGPTMAAGWQFLVPQAIMLTIGTAIAGAQVGFAALKHAPPRASPGTAEADNSLSARQVLPALGSQIEAAEERLGAAGQGGNGTFDFTPGGKRKDAGGTSNSSSQTASNGTSEAFVLEGLPQKYSHDPACRANPGCIHLEGNCCPTWDGLNLGCCFEWQSAMQTPEYVDADALAAAPYRHATMRDPFSGVLEAETMQPIYLLPVTNGLKQLVVFFVFGFDIKLKPNFGTWRQKLFRWLGTSLSRVFIIGLAVNAFRHDVRKFMTRDEEESSRYNEVMILMAVWCISPNFTMGLGIWNQLRLQSPGAVFRRDIAQPRYHLLWTSRFYKDVRFPLCPGGARWLTISKQVYALFLLPYVMPVMFLEWLMTILFCYWIIFKSKLLCLVKCLQVHLLTLFCCLVWLVTLGNSGAEKIDKYWTTLWPFVYMYLVYVFASFVVPLMMAVLFGILIGAHPSQIWKGIGLFQETKRNKFGLLHAGVRALLAFTANDSDSETEVCPHLATHKGECVNPRLAWLEQWYNFIMPHRELQLEDDDRDLLIRLDVYRLSKDFKFKSNQKTTLGGAAIVRAQLQKLRESMETGYPGSPQSSDGMMSDLEDERGLQRGCFDVLVGEETCQDGDINIERDPFLQDLLEDIKKEAAQKNEKINVSLDDSEVQIVMLTIKSLAEVAVVQALTIFLVRTLTGENFSDFVNAMNITIQERHVMDWLHHLAHVGRETIGQVRLPNDPLQGEQSTDWVVLLQCLASNSEDHLVNRDDERRRLTGLGAHLVQDLRGLWWMGRPGNPELAWARQQCYDDVAGPKTFMAASRGFGDIMLKGPPYPVLAAAPEVQVTDLCPDDWAIVLATRGVFS